jgi:hypothetical protein
VVQVAVIQDHPDLWGLLEHPDQSDPLVNLVEPELQDQLVLAGNPAQLELQDLKRYWVTPSGKKLNLQIFLELTVTTDRNKNLFQCQPIFNNNLLFITTAEHEIDRILITSTFE